MGFLRVLTSHMGDTSWSFLRFSFLYAPAALTLLALGTGGLMAIAEKWSFRDGFFFMAGSITGVANSMISKTPQTASGCFVEVLCVSFEISLAGVVIGVVGSHPMIERFVNSVEGRDTNED